MLLDGRVLGLRCLLLVLGIQRFVLLIVRRTPFQLLPSGSLLRRQDVVIVDLLRQVLGSGRDLHRGQ